MSYLVSVVGGPLDGRMEFTVDYRKVQELLFQTGDWKATRQVHVYRSDGRDAPFVYQGTRESREGEIVRSISNLLPQWWKESR